MHLCPYTDRQTEQRTDHQNFQKAYAGDLPLLVLSLIVHLLGPYLVLIFPSVNFSAYGVHKAHRLQEPRGPNQEQSR